MTRIQIQSFLTTPNLVWIIFTAFGIVGILLLLWNTPWGIGITHDSVFYLTSARNLTEGEGLYWVGDRGRLRPLTHFAPFYPILLSPLIALGVEPEVAALGIAAISLGLIVALLGYYIFRFTGRLRLGVITSALVLFSPVMLRVHTIALSEPVFILFLLGFLVSISGYLVKPTSRGIILVAGFAALGYLTRYVGITLLFTGVVAILVLGERDIRSRLGAAALFVALGILPMAVWMTRNFLLTGTMTNRTLRFHPPSGEVLLGFLDTLFSWMLPFDLSERYQAAMVILSVVVFGYLYIRTWRSSLRPNHKMGSLIKISTLFILIYLSSLAFSISFVDASTPLDNRILSPVYASLLMVTILLLWFHLRQRSASLVYIPVMVLVAIFAWNNWLGTTLILGNLRESGIGFTSKIWRESETIEWLSTIPEDALIYTNERFAISYITGRAAFSIPEKIDTVTAEVRPDFEGALAKMHERLETPQAYLLLFHPYGLRYGMPTRDEITFPLSRLEEFNDALVYIDPINRE